MSNIIRQSSSVQPLVLVCFSALIQLFLIFIYHFKNTNVLSLSLVNYKKRLAFSAWCNIYDKTEGDVFFHAKKIVYSLPLFFDVDSGG